MFLFFCKVEEHLESRYSERNNRGLGRGTRTPDLRTPNAAVYQTDLCPDMSRLVLNSGSQIKSLFLKKLLFEPFIMAESGGLEPHWFHPAHCFQDRSVASTVHSPYCRIQYLIIRCVSSSSCHIYSSQR